MPFIDNIALPDFKLMRHFVGARLGSLLQFIRRLQDGSDIINVGMRCTLQVATGPAEGIALLEGDDAGIILFENAGISFPVLDIDNLAYVVLHNSGPRFLTLRDPARVGDVFQASDRAESDFVCMAVGLADQSGVVGYLNLDGQKQGHIRPASPQFSLGKVMVVPKGFGNTAKP